MYVMILKQKPSARVNRRYILIDGANRDTIEHIIIEYVGVLGWAKASPAFTTISGVKGTVLSVERKSLEDVRAAFEVSNEKVKILRVSGTLKGLEK